MHLFIVKKQTLTQKLYKIHLKCEYSCNVVWQHIQTSINSQLDKIMDILYQKKVYILLYDKHLLGFAILRYLMIEAKPLSKLCVNELNVLRICALKKYINLCN